MVTLTGQAVRKATVRLQQAGMSPSERPVAYSETSDDAGKFVIDDLPPGSYTLSAARTGFVTGNYGARSAASPGATITLTEGGALKDLEIKLTPQGIVAGRVTDQDGEPVARAQLTLYRSTYARGRKQMRMASQGQTNSQGRYSLGNLTPGSYYLSARASDTSGMESGMSDVTTYYPRALDASEAAALDVAPGARMEGIDVRLRRERVHSVKGRLTLNGAPVKNSWLSVAPAGASYAPGTWAPVKVRDGSFTLRLLPGAYALQVVPEAVVFDARDNLLGLSGRMEITVTDSNLERVAFAVGPGVEVSGVFKLEGGDWSSLFSQAASAIRPVVGLTPEEGANQGGPPMKAEDDGTFQLRPHAAGTYLLDIAGLPVGTYVKSVRYGMQDVTRSPLRLAASGDRLEILLSAKAATVTGVLRDDDGRAMAGVLVTAWPKTPNPGTASRGIRSVYTDQNGTFMIGGLASGDYYVAAWDEIEAGLAQAPEFLGKFTNQAAAVKLEEGSRMSANVKMIPKEAVAAEAARLQ